MGGVGRGRGLQCVSWRWTETEEGMKEMCVVGGWSFLGRSGVVDYVVEEAFLVCFGGVFLQKEGDPHHLGRLFAFKPVHTEDFKPCHEGMRMEMPHSACDIMESTWNILSGCPVWSFITIPCE